MEPHNYRDMAAGLLLMAVGLFLAVYSASHYRLGTLLEMGPGLFPTALGCILAVFGALILIPAWFRPEPELEHPDYRGLVTVIGSMALFAVLLEPTGLVPASFAATFAALALGSRLSLPSKLKIATSIVALAYLIFKVGFAIRVPSFNWPF